jgi:hypothetical protein
LKVKRVKRHCAAPRGRCARLGLIRESEVIGKREALSA